MTPKPISRIVNIDNWHYKYYQLILWFFGFPYRATATPTIYDEEPTPRRKSLCAYCQTMFWGSLAILALSPLWVLGYAFHYVFAFLPKLIPLKWSKSFSNWIKKSLPVDGKDEPFLITGTLLGALSSIIMILLIGCVVGAGALILFFEQAMNGLVNVVFHASASIFTACGFIYWAIIEIITVLRIEWLKALLVLTVGAAVMAILVGLVGILDYLTDKLKDRFRQRYLKKSNGSFFSKTIETKDQKIKILGPLGLLKDLFWAIKYKACPVLEFATPQQIQKIAETKEIPVTQKGELFAKAPLWRRFSWSDAILLSIGTTALIVILKYLF